MFILHHLQPITQRVRERLVQSIGFIYFIFKIQNYHFGYCAWAGPITIQTQWVKTPIYQHGDNREKCHSWTACFLCQRNESIVYELQRMHITTTKRRVPISKALHSEFSYFANKEESTVNFHRRECQFKVWKVPVSPYSTANCSCLLSTVASSVVPLRRLYLNVSAHTT